MSKDKNNLTFSQAGLFQRGSLDVSVEFRKALSDAIRKSNYSRDQIVEIIEILTKIRISKHMLDQTTSSKQEYRFPAEVLHALCFITGSLEPLKILLNSIGCEVLEPAEAKEFKLMRLMREKERIEREIERLKGDIDGQV
ncbi:hypothetical protein [Thermodesulfovibrio thiophilus]|uniref:hypothetical protein n=1 Tax=Thermodesulfovibrio thiophilus TaxID=340095 RepID=UPI00041D6686|nr:hypothetical protein [Thermodesulfovibrio thiophilus]